jgi:DNA ligase-1
MVAPIRNHFVMRPDFRPMLAAKIKDENDIEYPILCTPKIDGIRCVTREKLVQDLFSGIAVEPISRYLNVIPNKFVQRILGEYNLTGLDGELITYDEHGDIEPYNTVQSKIMTIEGEPNFGYAVFDLVEPVPYWDRMDWLKNKLAFPKDCRLLKILPTLIESYSQLLVYEQACLEAGYEGVMIRSTDGPYKFGRSTMKQGWLLKLKRFLDDEATVIGFEELMRNGNEQVRNALGLAERSDHQANMVPANTLGALVCLSRDNIKFNIGTGFSDATRQEIWSNRETYLSQKVKFKYQPHGVKTAPRCPVFLGFRPQADQDPESALG